MTAFDVVAVDRQKRVRVLVRHVSGMSREALAEVVYNLARDGETVRIQVPAGRYRTGDTYQGR